MDIRSILERLNDYLSKIRRSWFSILLWALLFGTLLLFNSMLKPSFYQASTTFHPETGNQEGDNLSPINLLFGSEASGGSNKFMIGILKSRNLSEEVASDSLEIGGQKVLLADTILASLPDYSSIPSYILHLINGERGSAKLRNKVIQAAAYIRSSMVILNTEEGFIKLTISAYERELAGLISQSYIEQLSIYYSKRKTEKASRNVRFFSFRADSVKQELDRTNRQIANYVDKSRYKIFAKDEIRPVDLESKQAILGQIYTSLVISREQAFAQLLENTPVIQVLDPPVPPFRRVSSRKLLYTLAGLFLGSFLGVFLATRKLLFSDINQIVRQSLKLDQVPEEEEEKVEGPPS